MNETLTVILLILLVPGSLLSRTRDAMRFAHTASRAAKQSHQQAVWQRAFYPEARASEVQHEQFRSSAWQYWAMSIGAGAATVVRDDPFFRSVSYLGPRHYRFTRAKLVFNRSIYWHC